jgi:hypothetical protein
VGADPELNTFLNAIPSQTCPDQQAAALRPSLCPEAWQELERKLVYEILDGFKFEGRQANGGPLLARRQTYVEQELYAIALWEEAYR